MATTLLIWCRDDEKVTDAAKDYPAEFRYSGCRLAALSQTLGRLSGNDRLIITAHGNPYSFGDKGDSFSDFTVDKFADVLRHKAPDGWSGSIYFDTCYGLTFARSLKIEIADEFPHLKLFGCEGGTSMKVDLSKHQQA